MATEANDMRKKGMFKKTTNNLTKSLRPKTREDAKREKDTVDRGNRIAALEAKEARIEKDKLRNKAIEEAISGINK
jgi:hypothetical protein|tara:strand:+ start:35 stop:262 length:228 start_codon:yes stop_codon:yes gene_type:complete